MSVALGFAMAFALSTLVLAAMLWSVKRHTDPDLDIECGQPIDELLPSLSGLTHGALLAGNSVEIVQNGKYFEWLFAEIEAAKCSIHFETFLWKEGVLGARLAEALAAKARSGLQVRVLLDGDGCKAMGDSAIATLEQAGCRVVFYHAKRWRNIGVYNRRDHRKLVVIDGRLALAGGHCIVDNWLGDAQDGEHFRDIGVRLRGPAVHAMQSTFSENWVDETGELFVGDDVFPRLEPQGTIAVHVARVKPERATPAVKILHHLVLCLARKKLWVQNPYFLPDADAIAALASAVRRGVDVRIMVPSAEASDFPVVQHAAHRNFDRMLAAGVRIFEYPRTLLHQKVLMVDGIWCAIGSSNFDDRSFEINDEITLGFHDAGLAQELERTFLADAEICRELDLASWRGRGLGHRIKDRLFYLFNEQL